MPRVNLRPESPIQPLMGLTSIMEYNKLISNLLAERVLKTVGKKDSTNTVYNKDLNVIGKALYALLIKNIGFLNITEEEINLLDKLKSLGCTKSSCICECNK